MLTDDELMAMINAGHAEEGLAALQDRYRSRVYYRVRSILRDRQLAYEVAQDVFARVFIKSHLYRQGTSFHAWLFEVARNLALSALRARRHDARPLCNFSPSIGQDEGEDMLQLVPDDRHHRDAEEREFAAAFGAAVASLPERYHEVFELCVQRGKSYKEVARKLNVPIGTVAVRIMRARKRLFKELSRHLGRIRRPPACVGQ
jgi:RNA polymerase sigma-70 factor (ECF subfamily)